MQCVAVSLTAKTWVEPIYIQNLLTRYGTFYALLHIHTSLTSLKTPKTPIVKGGKKLWGKRVPERMLSFRCGRRRCLEKVGHPQSVSLAVDCRLYLPPMCLGSLVVIVVVVLASVLPGTGVV